jgi:hypothetical protein
MIYKEQMETGEDKGFEPTNAALKQRLVVISMAP